MVDGAVNMRTPDGAALLRLLASLGSPATKRAASQGLAADRAGVYPPDWVTEAGKPVPGRAWRRYDVFGDDEAVAVTFSYGEAEHAIVARVDLTGYPTAVVLGVTPNAADVIEGMTRDDDEFERVEPISLAEARGAWKSRWTGTKPTRSRRQPRHRSLPAGYAFPGPPATRRRRIPVIRAFLVPAVHRGRPPGRRRRIPEAARWPPRRSPRTRQPTRFWAEVLTGYSSHVPGEPPGQVGPRKLTHILLGNVPSIFTLTPAQRQPPEPAVTAWIRWSATRRGLDETRRPRT